MRLLVFLTLLLSPSFVFSQDFRFPKLAEYASAYEKIAPKNWNIIDTVYGDLNMDNNPDMAVVLEYDSFISENRAYGHNDIELITEYQKPRILAVYLRDKLTQKLKLVVQNNSFILRAKEGGIMGDPFKRIEINDNTLILAFEGGSEWRWKLNYTFKYQNKDLILTYANSIYYNVISGEMTDHIYDFLDRKLTLVNGNIFSRNIKNSVDEETLIFGQPRKLSEFKKPWTWEILNNNFL